MVDDQVHGGLGDRGTALLEGAGRRCRDRWRSGGGQDRPDDVPVLDLAADASGPERGADLGGDGDRPFPD
ncbi:hypothetical protein ACWEJZ_31550 [Streptomyces bacillaris]